MKSRDGTYVTNRSSHGGYSVRFYCEENIRRHKRVKTKTERDALVRAVKRRDNLDYWYPHSNPAGVTLGSGTFDELADRWLSHGECVREISESCLNTYRSHLKIHIRPVLRSKVLQELDITDIESVAEVLKKTKPKTRSYRSVRNNRIDQEFFEDDEFLSMSYRREILTVACMVTKFGKDRNLIVENPFAEYKLPETPEQPYDYWRLNEEDSFLQWLEDGGHFTKQVAKKGTKASGKPQYFDRPFKMRPGKSEELYDVVLFALRSGLRKGEIGALRQCDVNFPSNSIMVRRSWCEKERRMKNTTKGKTYRRIELNEDMKKILLKRIKRVKSDQDLLFDVRTWAVKNFSKYCVKAGVREIHFHSLRHTCLTNLANGYGMEKPLPLPQVQLIAGHKEITTTQRYIHTHGIENTTSLQWSREQRKAMNEEAKRAEEPVVKTLRLVKGSGGI